MLDPARIASSEYYLALFKWVVRFAAKPIVSLIWGNQAVWGKWHRDVSTRADRGPEAWYEMRSLDPSRRRLRVYDRIHNWRMARLKDRMPAGQPRFSRD